MENSNPYGNKFLPYLREDRLPHIFCPGCGNGTIMNAFIKGMEKAEMDFDSVAMVSGIGCSSRIPGYMDCLERMGFTGGNVLEPAMGTGHFFGTMPEEIRNNSRLYGVELDSLTGRIAAQLYQRADIKVCGYEATNYQDNFFDAAVGNVPFGQYKVADARYNKLNYSIHDYYFAKTLDKVRPGGVVAFVTSRYTMDKENPSVRRYIAQRAELLGAVRLPNTAFKSAAGTEVVSDILFLQKRERVMDVEPEWIYTGKTDDGIAVNEYFVRHPEMVCGKLELASSAYGPTPTCSPIEGKDLGDMLFPYPCCLCR